MKRPSLGSALSLVVQFATTIVLCFAVWIAYCDWRESCIALQETQAWVDELRASKATRPEEK